MEKFSDSFGNQTSSLQEGVGEALVVIRYSIIIPVFNRPDELRELVDSLTHQTVHDFEVVVVEDGSDIPCREVCDDFEGQLEIKYFEKPNSGPGQSRNYGVERAKGEYVIILDSDVVLPEGYLAAIDEELSSQPCDAFGGPDRAADSFTRTQKAISYWGAEFSSAISSPAAVCAAGLSSFTAAGRHMGGNITHHQLAPSPSPKSSISAL